MPVPSHLLFSSPPPHTILGASRAPPQAGQRQLTPYSRNVSLLSYESLAEIQLTVSTAYTQALDRYQPQDGSARDVFTKSPSQALTARQKVKNPRQSHSLSLSFVDYNSFHFLTPSFHFETCTARQLVFKIIVHTLDYQTALRAYDNLPNRPKKGPPVPKAQNLTFNFEDPALFLSELKLKVGGKYPRWHMGWDDIMKRWSYYVSSAVLEINKTNKSTKIN